MWAVVLCLLSHPTKFCIRLNDNSNAVMNNNGRKDTFFKTFLKLVFKVLLFSSLCQKLNYLKKGLSMLHGTEKH